jgi:serine/threonine protein kinase
MFDPPLETPLEPGSLIDNRYQLLELIGAGAMGTVLLCQDTTLRDSKIVLKFLRAEYVQDQKQFERFKNEALLMRELNHPNIVHVYDLCRVSDDEYYISMEYITGSSMRCILDDATSDGLPFRDVMHILKEVARGMLYAHQKGIIHRDLKPDNVLVSSAGEVKLTDFGLGKTLVIDENITDLGEAVGTPHYMSPEQLRGLKLDVRCDIYAFGIMAYELITGKKPYEETNYLKLAGRHLNDPLPLIRAKQHRAPHWVNRFLAKCTAKDREKRFQSFEEIERVLETFATSRLEGNPKLSNNFGGKIYWYVRWTIERYRLKTAALGLCTAFLLSIFVLLLGKNNHDLRALYSPSIVKAEHHFGLDLTKLKTFALGPRVAKLAQFDPESLIAAIKAENIEAVALLLKAGIPADTRDSEGKTALMLAVEHNSLEMLKVFVPQLDLGIINAKDRQGRSALVYAINQSSLPMVQALVAAGADVASIDKALSTPLIIATQQNETEIARFLLENGAAETVLHENADGKTARELARELKNREALKLLK